jgi:hypothetical protein
MINWKIVVSGFILSIVLALLFEIIAGTIGSYFGVILAGVIVGYMVNDNIRNGAIHGAIMGVIGGIILGILVIILVLSIGGTLELLIALGGLIEIILTIIIWGVLGAIGGVIGSWIILSRKKGFTEDEGSFQITKSEEKNQIKFNRENMLKCVCAQCGVQKESECAQNKMKMLQISMRGMSPEPSEFPGMYCANGKAVCNDLDPDKTCNCINCDVWKENDLASGQPGSYFCQNGKAK